MKINEKYIEALREINDWTTVANWAIKVGELYPDLLAKANKEAANHKRPSTGLRELAARISSCISTGDFAGLVEVDTAERPRNVRYLSVESKAALIERDITSDTEPLTRDQRIAQDLQSLSTKDFYRLEEMKAVVDTLNSYFRLDFEIDHSDALLNAEKPGRHHPDNLQILLKSHNRNKHNNNWNRFTIEEQIDYINSAMRIQAIVAKNLMIDLDEKVIESVIDRLRLVY
ncbi:MAG: HNH endonuclease [Deltaproteobacteria bacterium]|nr:HNH endonuclease [Deltaproteobacteria bacterium]